MSTSRRRFRPAGLLAALAGGLGIVAVAGWCCFSWAVR